MKLKVLPFFLPWDKTMLFFCTCCWIWVHLSFLMLTAAAGHGTGNKNPGIDEQQGGAGEAVDKKAVLTRPLDQGIYIFERDGTVPKEPLRRLRDVHREMINTLKAVSDVDKLSRYIISITKTVQEDVATIHKKFMDSGVGVDGKTLIKTSLKADAFIFLAGHASLISHLVMYFPDVMRRVFSKEPKIDINAKWALRYVVDAKLVSEERTAKVLNLAQQELLMIPRDKDFQNPYHLEEALKREPQDFATTTTTKKPRKKLQRGPRLSGGAGAEL